jgi:hypothetical protein
MSESAPCRSARRKAPQPEKTPKTLTIPDVEAPVKHQQNGSKAKGKSQHAAPKVTTAPGSTATNLHTLAIDIEVDPKPPSLTQTAPHENVHPKCQGSSTSPSTQPVKKKQKVDLQPAPENLDTKIKKKPSRSPLPERINRVIHPGKPAMPRPKRTSAEVAEAKAKKAELLRQLEELDKQKKIVLAEMELEEEEEDMEEEQTAVRHLRDLQDDESKELTSSISDFSDDGLEKFPMGDEEPLMFPDSDEDESLDTEDDDREPKSTKTKPMSV